MNNSFKILAISVSATVLLAACGSTPKKVDTPPPAPMPVAAPASMPVAAMHKAEVDPLNDPNGVLAKRSVYFDFDSYTVKSEDADLNSAHAKYLVAHNSRHIVIQGNTDSRGGREYNLALGQKRAEAESKTLAALGVSAGQMEVISFGKEKPKADGNNEAAWTENRRADIVYSGN